MTKKVTVWYRVLALVMMLILLLPVLAACGDDDEGEITTPSSTAPAATTHSATTPVATTLAATKPVATTPAATTPKATPTLTVSNEPVKIGILISWSGPAAKAGILVDQLLKIVDKQLEERGGINVGGVMRPVKWVKYDDQTQVANAVAGYKKLVTQDKVSAVLFGGAVAASLTATSDTAEETHVPVFSVGSTPVDLSNRPYTIRCVYPNATDIAPVVTDFALKQFKPKTAGILMAEMKDVRDRASVIKKIMEAAGVKIVYEQYAEITTSDFSPLLTRIKYENPDVLFVDSGGGDAFFVAIQKQISALGGWGNIKFLGCSTSSTGPALKEAGADGTYHWTMWVPGQTNPGAKAFEEIWTKQYTETLTAGHVIIYYPFWTAIKAIEMAGSDKPEDIQKAARSGNFVWEDAPGGPLKINADGTKSMKGMVAFFKDGKLVPAQ